MEIKRKNIGMYSKLRITFCLPFPEHDDLIFFNLKKKKYSFTRRFALTKLELLNKSFRVYSVNVDSLEDAVKLKRLINKINKTLKTK